MATSYEKRLVGVRYRLRGRADIDPAWLMACEALEFARPHHQGMRADGVTAEFEHQLAVVQSVMTLPGLLMPVETVTAAILHDTVEDAPVSVERVRDGFGATVADAVERLSKVVDGRKKALPEYFAAMAECPIASIVKGCDRGHNMGSLNNPKPDGSPARPVHKQLEQADETERYVLPMLKQARLRFVAQELAYENLKNLLVNQVSLVGALNEARLAGETPSRGDAPAL